MPIVEATGRRTAVLTGLDAACCMAHSALSLLDRRWRVVWIERRRRLAGHRPAPPPRAHAHGGVGCCARTGALRVAAGPWRPPAPSGPRIPIRPSRRASCCCGIPGWWTHGGAGAAVPATATGAAWATITSWRSSPSIRAMRADQVLGMLDRRMTPTRSTSPRRPATPGGTWTVRSGAQSAPGGAGAWRRSGAVRRSVRSSSSCALRSANVVFARSGVAPLPGGRAGPGRGDRWRDGLARATPTGWDDGAVAALGDGRQPGSASSWPEHRRRLERTGCEPSGACRSQAYCCARRCRPHQRIPRWRP